MTNLVILVLRHSTKNKNNLYTVSDHNIIIGKFKLKFARREALIRREYFNFKVDENRAKFFEATSESTNLTSWVVDLLVTKLFN